MGLDPNSLPDHVKNKIADPVEKKKVGPTWAEKVAKKDSENETLLRNQLISFCRRYNLIPISPNPKEKSTIIAGAADLTICGPINRVLLMELKVGANKLSPEQEKFSWMAMQAQCDYHVIRDYESGIKLIIKHFNLTVPPQTNE